LQEPFFDSNLSQWYFKDSPFTEVVKTANQQVKTYLGQKVKEWRKLLFSVDDIIEAGLIEADLRGIAERNIMNIDVFRQYNALQIGNKLSPENIDVTLYARKQQGPTESFRFPCSVENRDYITRVTYK